MLDKTHIAYLDSEGLVKCTVVQASQGVYCPHVESEIV